MKTIYITRDTQLFETTEDCHVIVESWVTTSVIHLHNGDIKHRLGSKGHQFHRGEGNQTHHGEGDQYHSGKGDQTHVGKGDQTHSGEGPQRHYGKGDQWHYGNGCQTHCSESRQFVDGVRVG